MSFFVKQKKDKMRIVFKNRYLMFCSLFQRGIYCIFVRRFGNFVVWWIVGFLSFVVVEEDDQCYQKNGSEVDIDDDVFYVDLVFLGIFFYGVFVCYGEIKLKKYFM